MKATLWVLSTICTSALCMYCTDLDYPLYRSPVRNIRIIRKPAMETYINKLECFFSRIANSRGKVYQYETTNICKTLFMGEQKFLFGLSVVLTSDESTEDYHEFCPAYIVYPLQPVLQIHVSYPLIAEGKVVLDIHIATATGSVKYQVLEEMDRVPKNFIASLVNATCSHSTTEIMTKSQPKHNHIECRVATIKRSINEENKTTTNDWVMALCICILAAYGLVVAVFAGLEPNTNALENPNSGNEYSLQLDFEVETVISI